MNQPTVTTYLLESVHGVTLDVDPGLKSLISRHIKSSSSPAIAYLVQNGMKKEVQRIKC